MKPALCAVSIMLLMIGGWWFFANGPLDKMGEPFYSAGMTVEWRASTNDFPAVVQTYEFVPARISAASISNMTRLLGEAPFVHSGDGRWSCHKHFDFAEQEDPPAPARALALGTNLVTHLGIPLEELWWTHHPAENVCFHRGSHSRFDKVTGKRINGPSGIDVIFDRRLDHFRCDGDRVEINYSNLEKIQRLEVQWRGVRATGSFPMAGPEQIMAWIKEGRARVYNGETTGMRTIEISRIKRLTVKEAHLRYATNVEVASDRPYPYATLVAEAELSPGDKFDISLACPVITDRLSRAVCASGTFNIISN